MRDIKFRGKRVHGGEWAYGYYCYRSNVDVHLICGCGLEIPVDEKTVSQFTGLRDSRHKGICEGDIVRVSTLLNTNLKNPIYKVVFADGCFEIQRGKFRDYLKCGFADFNIEVVGNIYDNPEMLEGKE